MARRGVNPVLYVLLVVLVTIPLWAYFLLQNPTQHGSPLQTNSNGRHDGGHSEDNAVVDGDYLLGVGKADITGQVSG